MQPIRGRGWIKGATETDTYPVFTERAARKGDVSRRTRNEKPSGPATILSREPFQDACEKDLLPDNNALNSVLQLSNLILDLSDPFLLKGIIGFTLSQEVQSLEIMVEALLLIAFALGLPCCFEASINL